MIVNTGKSINDPKAGDVVFFQPWQHKTDKRKKAYPVLIESGCFLDPTSGRVTNFWYWYRLTPTGRRTGELEHGYGNFTIAEGYRIETKVVVLK